MTQMAGEWTGQVRANLMGILWTLLIMMMLPRMLPMAPLPNMVYELFLYYMRILKLLTEPRFKYINFSILCF